MAFPRSIRWHWVGSLTSSTVGTFTPWESIHAAVRQSPSQKTCFLMQNQELASPAILVHRERPLLRRSILHRKPLSSRQHSVSGAGERKTEAHCSHPISVCVWCVCVHAPCVIVVCARACAWRSGDTLGYQSSPPTVFATLLFFYCVYKLLACELWGILLSPPLVSWEHRGYWFELHAKVFHEIQGHEQRCITLCDRVLTH